ncbi:MAG TPA: extracellular solute-binding protein [Chloroflexota bacterium]
MKRIRVIAFLAASGLAACLAACGGSAPAASSPAAPAGGLSVDQIYTAAKTEGQLAYFAPTPPDVIKQMIDAFGKKYPGVKVNYTDLTAEQTVERIITESKTGKGSIDISQASLASMLPLVDRNLIAKPDWKALGVRDDQVIANGLAATYYQLPDTVVYNASLVKPADAPMAWEDLLKPQWKGGKMLLDSRGHFIEHLGFVWGEDRLLQFARDLKAQQPLLIPRMVDGIQRVAAGEAPLATVSVQNMLDFQAKGAPVELTALTPIDASTFAMYMLEGAPHPNAARLFLSWALSPDGRALFEKVGHYGMAQPGSGTQVGKLLEDHQINIWSAQTPQQARDQDKFSAEIQKIFTG